MHNAHIVAVSDLFDENNTSYYVMTYIDGKSLDEVLKSIHRPMTESDVKKMLFDVLDALSTAYSVNPPIYHLDITPRNIMVDKSGKCILIDFGASKQPDPDGNFTTTSMPFSERYAPLEQLTKDFENIGRWTDFYSLGATMYALLTNDYPPSPYSIMADHTPDKSKSIVLPSNVSKDTRELIVWMMQPEGKDRPHTIEQISGWYKRKEDLRQKMLALEKQKKEEEERQKNSL